VAPQLDVETQTGELSTEPMKKAASSCIPGAAGFSACGTFWMPNSPDFATLMAVGMKEVVCMAAYNTLSEGAVLEEERAGHPAKWTRRRGNDASQIAHRAPSNRCQLSARQETQIAAFAPIIILI